jgi:hypothetical protein
MHRYFQLTLVGLAGGALVLACGDSTTGRQASRPGITDPTFSLQSSNWVSTPVGRGTAEAFHIQSKADGFDVELKAKDITDVAVSNVAVGPGGSSGWHTHPGPVLVIVRSGAITFYRAGHHGNDGEGEGTGNSELCTRTVYPAGVAFIEYPQEGHSMLARNEGTVDAAVTATYLAPKGAALRIDKDPPGGNCPTG